MTNFDYIMKQMNDVDLAVEIMKPYDDSDKITIFQQAEDAYWNSEISSGNKSEKIQFQIWLSKQYNPAEWESGN